MKKRKVVLWSLVGAFLISSFTGCTNTDSAGEADGEKTITIGLSNDITSLDYAYNYTMANFQVVDNINDYLLNFDAEGNMEPSICTSWEAVDELTYVYQIRDDVKFSDGTDMTVDDVVYSMNRIKDPENASDMNWAYANVDTVEATGDWEVTVTLTQPDSSWQYMAATPACEITSQEFCEAAGDSFGTADGLTIGTGAYKVESWTTGNEVVLTKNEYYWGEEPYYDKIVYTVISEENSMALAMTSGQIDFCIPASTDLADTYKNASGCDIYSVDGIGVTLLSFNCATGPCSDVNLRKAISSCVDLATLQNAYLGEYGVSGLASPFGSGLFVLDPDEWEARISALDNYDYDLDKAKEYLDASSYDGSTINFIIIEGNSIYANYAQAIQAEAKKIGIEIEITQVTTSEYYAHAYGNDLDENGNRKYDMAITRWVPDYVDPAGDLVPFYSSANVGAGGSNYAAYVNEDVDNLLALQSATSDNAERSEYLIQAVELANEDCPYKTLYSYGANYCKVDTLDFELPGFWLYSFFVKDMKPVE